ncbi:hypothetical protein IFO70_10495 [Phormidium tenue FACHB-886]|nr:hypothetical protein [Phormidium tenue FACHB-886]
MPTFPETAAKTVLALGNFRIILCNLAEPPKLHTEPALILNGEMTQAIDGYASVAFAPINGSYSEATQKWSFEPVNAVFSEPAAGTGYQFTDAVLWQGRGAISNKPIQSIDTANNTISCNMHGLVSGDYAFVGSTGSLPTGLATQRYWVQVLDTNTVRLHTNQALSAPVDLTGEGFGSLRLIHANGAIVDSQNFGLNTINPGASQSFVIGWKQSYV